MPRTSPYSITLADAERAELEARARRYTSPYSDVVRARIVLYAAEGLGNDEIAARLDTPRQVVSKWRKRFYDEGLVGLTDLPRGGRPPSFSPRRRGRDQGAGLRTAGEDRHAAGSLAVPRPGPRRRRVRHRRLHLGHHDLALAEFGCNKAVAASVLDLPPRPDFGAKAARVLDLYARRFDDTPLRPDEFVISADEKTSIQARVRKHATTPPAPRRAMRVEHEYARGGALAYLAAWDVHRAKVFGRCEHTTGIEPFDRLVEQVMTCQPYASARRVFWVVDNGSSHRGQASIDRLEDRWPTLRLIHLPVHASWLNQVEMYFSVVQRKAFRPTTSATSATPSPACSTSSNTTNRSPHRSNGSSPRTI